MRRKLISLIYAHKDSHLLKLKLYFFGLLTFFFNSCTEQVKTNTNEATFENNLITINKQMRGAKPANDTQISDIVRRIFQDKNEHFWLGTNSDGIIYFNGDSLFNFSTQEGLSGYQITAIIEDKQGKIWLATNRGITVYDGTSFITYTEKNGLCGNSVWSLFEDSKGIVWAGTTNGVCYFNGKEFTSFSIPSSNLKNTTFALSRNLVWCITEDRKGNLWFGTDGNGIYVYDGKSFQQITTDDGLCNNSITCILIDRNENSWFSSMFGGISRYDGKLLTNFSKKEGLNILAVQSIYEDKKGNLWFGGAGGLYKYNGKTFLNIKTNGPWK